jgi:hypothetical protein
MIAARITLAAVILQYSCAHAFVSSWNGLSKAPAARAVPGKALYSEGTEADPELLERKLSLEEIVSRLTNIVYDLDEASSTIVRTHALLCKYAYIHMCVQVCKCACTLMWFVYVC